MSDMLTFAPNEVEGEGKEEGEGEGEGAGEREGVMNK